MPDKNCDRKILVIDETMREGMQFQGVVFSLEQRIKILEFQENLGVDICQTGYPSAHPMEAEIVSQLAAHVRKNNFKIRTAALGRAFAPDAEILCDTGVDDPHFHLQIKNSITREKRTKLFQELGATIGMVRDRRPGAMISMAMLDIGRTDPQLLIRCCRSLSCDLEIEILSLPDTSGIMAPCQLHDRIKTLAMDPTVLSPKTKIAVHCHNDMGMASANSLMGIMAGASVLELSVLGIGERNGIGDLFTTVKQLKKLEIDTGIDTNNLTLFKKYYQYLDDLVREQTGHGLIQYNTPVFGEGAATHVAGTHALENFGTTAGKKFYLNLLCGRAMVQKYLNLHKILYDEKMIPRITAAIKTLSSSQGRRLTKDEVRAIAASMFSNKTRALK